MNFIPIAHFVSAIMLFGMMMYFFIPIVDFITTSFPTSGVYSTAIMFLFAVLPAINLFGSGVRFVIIMQGDAE